MNKECIQKILEAAVRAPSGDNVQPWDIRVSENFTQIDVFNLPEKDDSIYNYEQAASYIAHGAFLENLLIAARHLGCQAGYQLFPDQQNPNHVTQIKLTEADPKQDPYYLAIFQRYTNRFPYQKTEISAATLNALKDSIENINGAHVNLITEPEKIKKIADIFKLNDRIVFENQAIHDFLFDKIRWNKKQMEETQDGMPVDVLGLNPVEKVFFPLLRFWGYVKVANRLGLSKMIELKCWWNYRQASVLGMLSIKGHDKKAFIEGGRAVQRFWLEATRQGFSLQPVIGLTLLIHRLKNTDSTRLSAHHQLLVKQVNQQFLQYFDLNEKDSMLMGFRLGAGSQFHSAKTLRKPVLNIMIE